MRVHKVVIKREESALTVSSCKTTKSYTAQEDIATMRVARHDLCIEVLDEHLAQLQPAIADLQVGFCCSTLLGIDSWIKQNLRAC